MFFNQKTNSDSEESVKVKKIGALKLDDRFYEELDFLLQRNFIFYKNRERIIRGVVEIIRRLSKS
jgi:hypothetical protein